LKNSATGLVSFHGHWQLAPVEVLVGRADKPAFATDLRFVLLRWAKDLFGGKMMVDGILRPQLSEFGTAARIDRLDSC